MIVSAAPGVIEHKDGSLAAFILGLIIMGLGTGFFKANIAPLVAEQYTRTKQFIRVEKNGERVIVDPVFTISRVYMVSLNLFVSIFLALTSKYAVLLLLH